MMGVPLKIQREMEHASQAVNAKIRVEELVAIVLQGKY